MISFIMFVASHIACKIEESKAATAQCGVNSMNCPNCEKEIKAAVETAIIEEDRIDGPPVEVVSLHLTCEHCQTEMYTSVLTSAFETI